MILALILGSLDDYGILIFQNQVIGVVSIGLGVANAEAVEIVAADGLSVEPYLHIELVAWVEGEIRAGG
jgi:hypothetical protein